jgi:hypothetical protein
MKRSAILPALAVFFLGAVICSAQSPHMGTWNLNAAKSKFAAGATRNNTVAYEAAGDMTKVTVDGTDGSGAATHNEWTGKFDGKYYDVNGSPTANKRAYKKVNSRTLTFREQKDGKVVLTGTITIARSGKTRTVTTRGLDAKGKWITNVAVFDKQ